MSHSLKNIQELKQRYINDYIKHVLKYGEFSKVSIKMKYQIENYELLENHLFNKISQKRDVSS